MSTNSSSSVTGAANPVSADTPVSSETMDLLNTVESVSEPRRLRPLRFATGLMLTTCGMSTILIIGVQFLEVQQLGGDFALAVVAVGVLTGVILLGGGFGLMATASSGFDEREFHSLMKAGNISSAVMVADDPAEQETKAA